VQEELQVGDVVGQYEVTRVRAFGPLPYAVIREGYPNAGVRVILKSPFKS